MEATIQRVTLNPDTPTFGVLLVDNAPFCVTLELPWKDNAHDVSCIPAGKYTIVANVNKDKPFRILNVPNRTEIDIHAGNSVRDTLGCVIAGTYFHSDGVAESSAAMDRLKARLKLPCLLTVINPAT